MSNWVHHKLNEAMRRGYFRTIDLFAGCGGMSLGFHRAKFKSVASIELNEIARNSHKMNFAPLAFPESYAEFADITQVRPNQAVNHLTNLIKGTEDVIDVIIGGPPCQAFSRLGRAALWRLAGKDHAHADDKRATLFLEYLVYVAELKPIAFVMENVREMGKFAGRNIAEEIALTAENLGYEIRYTILNAVWYGVPQLRERMFIIGIRKELEEIPGFPEIRFDYDLPSGYSTSRAGMGHYQVLPPYDHYVDHADQNNKPERAISAAEAFADLPAIYEHLDGRQGKGHRRQVDDEVEYKGVENSFTTLMKNWPGFQPTQTCTDHVIRYTPRDYEIFHRMPHGGMYPEALKVAKEIFVERITQEETASGKRIVEGSPEWKKIFKETVPPYKEHRYPNKFRKMWPDHPARTVPAHIGKDSYSHIHFDSEQARCISLREAARLQSFPDAFKFCGSMNARLTQIGNAVPPLLAYAVADTLSKQLKRAHRRLTHEKALAQQS